MSFAESFNEITNIRRNGLDLFDIANEVISLESIKDNKTEYNKKIIEFGFENINIAYEEVITTVLDAIRRFFEKLWVAIKSFFSEVVVRQKNYISNISKKYNILEKLSKVKSTINITDARVEECIEYKDLYRILTVFKTINNSIFAKVTGFRLYGFIEKDITGISNDEFDNGIDIIKSLPIPYDRFKECGFSVVNKETTTGDFTVQRQELLFDKSSVKISYTSDNLASLIKHDKSVSDLGYDIKNIKILVDTAIAASETIIKNHSLVVNDIDKVKKSVTKIIPVKDKNISVLNRSSKDSTVAEKCNKAVGICNTFTSMIQAVVLASGFYNTTVQTTIDRIYDAIKAHVEANLANRP